VFDRWKSGAAMMDTLRIDKTWEKWAENDTTVTDNGVVDHPWTTAADTLYLKQHVLAPDTTVAQARASVQSDLEWDSLRFRYKLERAANVRLMIFRNADTLWSLGSETEDYWQIGVEDDTVCVFRSNLDDTLGVSRFDEARWGEPWSWIAENFGYKLKSGQGDTARIINEVVWNGEIDTSYVRPGPFPDDPGTTYPRYGADCDSNFIADEGIYLARLEVDEFSDPGFAPEDTLKLEKTKAIIVDRWAPYVKKLELWNIWPGESQPETTVIREAEWRPHPLIPNRDSLFVDEQNYMSLDTLEIHLQFSERMSRGDSLQIKYKQLQEEDGMEWAFTVTKWDTVVYPDDKVVARSNLVWTSVYRSMWAGKYGIRVRAFDTALNQLDAWPATRAQRADSGKWVNYQSSTDDETQTQEGGWDENHHFVISPWQDGLFMIDVSPSVNNASTGWQDPALYFADDLLELMEADHEDSGRADKWRAALFRYWGKPSYNEMTMQLSGYRLLGRGRRIGRLTSRDRHGRWRGEGVYGRRCAAVHQRPYGLWHLDHADHY
jgi:hypothetical protein